MANAADYALQELNKETAIGGVGLEVERSVPRIDLTDFDARKAEITDELWSAATDIGFFQLENHGVPLPLIDEAFAKSKAFFDLPEAVKAQYPLVPGTNSGWEYKAQVRPSTGTADQKESYQITISRMEELGLWPTPAGDSPVSKPPCWRLSAPTGAFGDQGTWLVLPTNSACRPISSPSRMTR